MKKYIIGIAVIAVILIGYSYGHKKSSPMAGGQYFIYSPTSATSSVGSVTQTLVLSADSSRQYASFCNASTTIASFISLQVGATSTSPSGIQIPGGSCYEMTPEKGNLFTTSVYAQTTAGTSTLTVLSQSKSN